MNEIDWQNRIALGLVGLAATYMLTRVMATVRRRACGGGCSSCPSSNPANEPNGSNIVPVEQLAKSAKRF